MKNDFLEQKVFHYSAQLFSQDVYNTTCTLLCITLCISRREIHVSVIFEGQTGEPLNLAGPIAGGVVALIVAVAGIFVSVFVFRRR